MKRKLLQISMLLATLSLAGLGCARPNNGGPPEGDAPATPAQVAPIAVDGYVFNTGDTVVFTPNQSALNQFANSIVLNDPKNFKLNVDLTGDTSGGYGGRVVVAFEDNGRIMYGMGEANAGVVGQNQSWDNKYTGKSYLEYNRWYRAPNGQTMFRGFFQDRFVRSLVLMIDNGFNQGDGGALTDLGGKIFFKAFNNVPDPTQKPQTPCWYLGPIGPFFCAGYLTAGGVIGYTSDPNPGQGYVLLGEFTGLNRAKAFKP